MFGFAFLKIPIMFIAVAASLFPTVETLPFGIDTILVTGFSNFLFVADAIPPLMTMYNAFLWVIAWKIGLRMFKLIPFIHRLLP